MVVPSLVEAALRRGGGGEPWILLELRPKYHHPWKGEPQEREFIDYTTSMITDDDPCAGHRLQAGGIKDLTS